MYQRDSRFRFFAKGHVFNTEDVQAYIREEQNNQKNINMALPIDNELVMLSTLKRYNKIRLSGGEL
jgi:hypothetical protein